MSAILLIVLFLGSCAPPPPPPPPPPPINTPTGMTLILKQVEMEQPKTMVEFLIDNSNSVEKECGNLGFTRYDFVNFMLNIFRTVPESLSQNLYVGAGSFGNDGSNYMSNLDPTPANSATSISKPAKPGNDQSFSNGIQKALEHLLTVPADKRYLFLITDGKLSGELSETVEAKLREMSSKDNITIIVGLICSNESNRALWKNNYGFIANVYVFESLEESATQLLAYIKPFLPANSIIISPKEFQSLLSIPGYYTKTSFFYWNAFDNNSLSIGDDAIKDFWQVESGVRKDIEIQPINGCPQHNYTINSTPPDHWLLFIKKQTFQGLNVSIKSLNGEPIEIINNVPTDYQLEFDDNLASTDLGNWKDCFSAQLIWEAPNQGNGTVINPTPCKGVLLLCLESRNNKLYTEASWIPQFTNTGMVKIKIRFGAINDGNGIIWESEPQEFPIQFKPEYDFSHPSSPILLKENQTEPIYKIDFVFKNVVSPTQLVIYLVSDAVNIDNNKCPYPINPTNDQKIYPLSLEQSCDSSNLVNGNNACVSFVNNGSLEFLYTAISYKHVFSECKYNQVYFDWLSRPDEQSKEVTWLCTISEYDTKCENTPKPDFLP